MGDVLELRRKGISVDSEGDISFDSSLSEPPGARATCKGCGAGVRLPMNVRVVRCPLCGEKLSDRVQGSLFEEL